MTGLLASEAPPLLAFVVNTDGFFLSHRLPIALAARRAGFEVLVIAEETGSGCEILENGLRFVPFSFARGRLNPLAEAGTLVRLERLYRSLTPALLHHVTIKPVVYGSLAARAVPDARVVNALSGLGWTFSRHRRAALLNFVGRPLFRIALRRPRTRAVFQNPDDRRRLLDMGMVAAEQTIVIRGSGVDCSRFLPRPEPNGAPIVMLASRMLWDKGVREFVGAAPIVRRQEPRVRFVLVGDTDEGNPTAVPVSRLERWNESGEVEWWGHRADMPDVMAMAAIIVLPSFHEGLPKVLLEAAACGRPIVASDVAGCREIVSHGENGLLVPAGDSDSLAEAILDLVRSPDRRAQFGRAGRARAVSEFAVENVVERTLAVYRDLLGSKWPGDR